MKNLAERLRAGDRKMAAIFIGGPSPDLVEMAGLAGADFVILDGEHGPVWSELPHLLRAARAFSIPAIVRVLAGRVDMIGQALDFGADGVLVPGIRTLEEARAALAAARYAPKGVRGLAFSSRAAGYGYQGGPDYLEDSNRRIAVLLQVETKEAVGNLEDLVRLAGVDGIFVGPTDLSVAYGENSRQTEKVRQIIEEIRQRAEEAGIPWGLFVASVESHREWRDRGSWYCATSVSNLMRSALAAWLDREPTP